MGLRRKKKKNSREKESLETQAQVAGAYSAMRPYAQEALQAAMYQQLAALQPGNSMLGMMGLPTQGGHQFGGVVSPMMMSVGQTSMAPGFANAQGTGLYAKEENPYEGMRRGQRRRAQRRAGRKG